MHFKAIRLLILLSALSLCHCGFHLRGHTNLPKWLDRVYIFNSSNLRTLQQALESQMRAYGIVVLDEPGKASYFIHVTHAGFEQNIISVSSSTTPRQYQIILLVDFKVVKNKGKEILPQQRVMVMRQVTINNNRILGSNFEEDTIKREMQRDAAYLLLNRIKDAHLNHIEYKG